MEGQLGLERADSYSGPPADSAELNHEKLPQGQILNTVGFTTEGDVVWCRSSSPATLRIGKGILDCGYQRWSSASHWNGTLFFGVNTASRVILFNGVCLSSRSHWENLLRCSVLGFCNPWLTSIPTPAHQAQSECLLNLDEGKAHIYLLSFWDTLIKGTAARFAFFRQVRSHHLSLLTFRSWESCKAAAPSSSGQVDRSCAALGPFTGRTDSSRSRHQENHCSHGSQPWTFMSTVYHQKYFR